MELHCGVYKNTYITKVYNHIIEIEMSNYKKTDYVSVWYNYKNNTKSINLFYNVVDDILYGANITEKQKEKIKEKIKKAIEIQYKMLK